MRTMTSANMDHLLKAIDADNRLAEEALIEAPSGGKGVVVKQTGEVFDRIQHLRFEDIRLASRCVKSLASWMKQKPYLRSISLAHLQFEEKNDWKELMHAICGCTNMKKVIIERMTFTSEMYGKALGKCILDCAAITELQIDQVAFDHPRSFYDMCQPMLQTRCRLNILKLKGVIITALEAKCLQYVLMKNKQINTMDFSECIDDNRQNFSIFFNKFDNLSNVRYLTLDSLMPDISNAIESLGEVLKTNKKLEFLSMSTNRIGTTRYSNFLTSLCHNVSLKKLNLHKTDLNDKVAEMLAEYIQQPDIKLLDLDLSKNAISDQGLKFICAALRQNTSITTLNLDQNAIKCIDTSLCNYLISNKTLLELSISANKITNEGIAGLSHFLDKNSTLKYLDLSKNNFSDLGFDSFAAMFQDNKGIKYLDISKCKELTDEGSLITLAQSIANNRCLETINMNQLRVRKPFLKSHMDAGLQKNITLTEIIGKLPPDTVEGQLKTNELIKTEISTNFQESAKLTKKSQFNFKLVDKDNTSFLDMSNAPSSQISPSFKFMRFHDVRAINLTNTGFFDTHMSLLLDYLNDCNSLYSIVLDKNQFTDQTISALANQFRSNKIVAHVSFQECPAVTQAGFDDMLLTLKNFNMTLWQVDFDHDQFSEESCKELSNMCELNKQIQQELKPRLEISNPDDFMRLKPEKLPDYVESEENQQDLNQSMRSLMQPRRQTVKDKLSAALQPDLERDRSDSDIFNASNLQRQVTMKTNNDSILVGENLIKRVVFADEAPIAKCFKAALKVFRIWLPNTIELYDKLLEDDQCIELIDFLQDKNLIKSLNLRKNRIGNLGAFRIAKFLTEQDSTLVDIDLNRNRIDHDGATELVDAVHGTIRIENFMIAYGNQIGSALAMAFEQEIKANTQIKKNLREELGQEINSVKEVLANATLARKFRRMKYEIDDKGQDFIRCAVKTTQLLNVLHLSLPDNLLGFKEAQLIASMINKNTPLKILNLSRNSFDFESAAIIGDSLLSNSNLKSLDMSYNRMGDTGIRNLLYPLLMIGLKQSGAIKDGSASNSLLLRSKTLAKKAKKGKQIEKDKQHAKAVEQEMQESRLEISSSSLIAISLSENYTTQESLRYIWLLLSVNKDILIDITKPDTFNWNFVIAADDETLVTPNNGTQVAPQSDTEANYDAQRQRANSVVDGDGQELDTAEVFDLEDGLTQEQIEEQEAQERKAESRRKCKKRCCNCVQKLTCFLDFAKQFPGNVGPSCGDVCCWRFYRSRQSAYLFETNSSVQNGYEGFTQIMITYWMVVNYFFHLTFLTVPYLALLTNLGPKVKSDNAVTAHIGRLWVGAAFMGWYLIYTLIFEQLVALILLKRSNFSAQACGYLQIKMLTGCLRRTTQCFQAGIAAAFFQDGKAVGLTISLVLTTFLIVGQIRPFQLVISSLRIRPSEILKYVERNLRMSKATGYEAIGALYCKTSIAPNQNMMRQAARLSGLQFDERDEEIIQQNQSYYSLDEHKQDKKSCCSSKAKYFWTRFGSTRYWQIFCSSCPLILISLVGHFTSKNLESHHLLYSLCVGMVSLISQCMQLNGNQQVKVVVADDVYEIAKNRLKQKIMVYEHYLGPNAHPEDDGAIEEFKIEEEDDEDASMDLSVDDKEKQDDDHSKKEDEMTLGEGDEEEDSPVKKRDKVAFLKQRMSLMDQSENRFKKDGTLGTPR